MCNPGLGGWAIEYYVDDSDGWMLNGYSLPDGLLNILLMVPMGPADRQWNIILMILMG